MATVTETRHAGEFMVAESAGFRSRAQIVVATGEVLLAGHVLGKFTLGAATPAAVAGNTGDGTVGTVTVGVSAKAGVYRLTCIEPATNLGKFNVEDPDGINVGVATVGTAFTGGGLTFTIADGSADFVSGDAFTITVAAGAGTYGEYDPAGTGGTAVVAGVLWDAVDATAADMAGVAIVRDAVVNAGELQYFTGASSNQKAAAVAQLANLGIIAR